MQKLDDQCSPVTRGEHVTDPAPAQQRRLRQTSPARRRPDDVADRLRGALALGAAELVAGVGQEPGGDTEDRLTRTPAGAMRRAARASGLPYVGGRRAPPARSRCLSNADLGRELVLEPSPVNNTSPTCSQSSALRSRVQAVVFAYEHGPARAGPLSRTILTQPTDNLREAAPQKAVPLSGPSNSSAWVARPSRMPAAWPVAQALSRRGRRT